MRSRPWDPRRCLPYVLTHLSQLPQLDASGKTSHHVDSRDEESPDSITLLLSLQCQCNRMLRWMDAPTRGSRDRSHFFHPIFPQQELPDFPLHSSLPLICFSVFFPWYRSLAGKACLRREIGEIIWLCRNLRLGGDWVSKIWHSLMFSFTLTYFCLIDLVPKNHEIPLQLTHATRHWIQEYNSAI